MKLLLCRDLRLGTVCTANLSTEQTEEWNTSRYSKFEHLLHSAGAEDTHYAVILGHMFGSNIVSAEYTNAVNALVSKEKNLRVITCVTEDDSRRLASSTSRPENLCVLTPSIRTRYEDEAAVFFLEGDELHIEDRQDGISFTVNINNGRMPEAGGQVPCFEPCGYEDATQDKFGYLSMRVSEHGVRTEQHSSSIYAFRFLNMEVTAEESEADSIARACELVSANDADTFVRFWITGTTQLGVEINCEKVAEELMKHVFFAEVIDESGIDLSGYRPETDISLANEFVRLAMMDNSLSEAERSRVIRSGWNVLKQREGAE